MFIKRDSECNSIWSLFVIVIALNYCYNQNMINGNGKMGGYMSYFGRLYLDKEKDIIVNLDMDNSVLSYTILVMNHKSDNLINNLAIITNQNTHVRDGKTVIEGTIPCYIKGDGQRVYIFRLNGTKLANIYPNGKIEVNSLIPAIAKTLMSQTKDY